MSKINKTDTVKSKQKFPIIYSPLPEYQVVYFLAMENNKKDITELSKVLYMKYTMYKRFTESVAWNAFESIVYHGMLLIHQLILFHHTSYVTYGHIGSLFAITYLAVTFINMGLDVSLAPFLSTFSCSKIAFRQFIRHQILPNYALYVSPCLFLFLL